mgnify:CR=1 FL=1
MLKTKFTLFKNTPFSDFQNTIHFKSNQERDSYFFDKSFFQKLEHTESSNTNDKEYNFIRTKSSIQVSFNYFDCIQCNYGCFEDKKGKVYFYIIECEYINDETTRINFLIDPIMTYTQGNILNTFTNLRVQRQHLSENDYQRMLPILKTNDDILTCNTKKYFKTETVEFKKYYILFQCAVDLTKDYGDVNDPIVYGSTGGKYDGITSPLNLYLATENNFNSLTQSLSKAPWITQNFSKVIIVPDILINLFDFDSIDTFDSVAIYKAKNGGRSEFNNDDYFKSLNKSKKDLLDLFDLDNQNEHLLRNHYFTIEMNNFTGQQLNIDISLLPEKGIKIATRIIVGYDNDIKIYLENYKADKMSGTEFEVDRGSFLNDSITFNSFDEVPIMINNYQLALGKSANQRSLAESKLISNRVKNVANPNANKFSRIMDAASILGNFRGGLLSSASNLGGKITDEYEFYRQQNAEFSDMALNQNSVTPQTTNNAFAIKNGFFGVTMKYSRPDSYDLDRIKYYYQKFGFKTESYSTSLSNINSMSLVNYVQFDGNYTIANVEPHVLSLLKERFSIGVFLWHDDGTKEVMQKTITQNKRVI